MNIFFVLDEVRFIHPRVSFITFDQTFPVISNFLTFHVSSSQHHIILISNNRVENLQYFGLVWCERKRYFDSDTHHTGNKVENHKPKCPQRKVFWEGFPFLATTTTAATEFVNLTRS